MVVFTDTPDEVVSALIFRSMQYYYFFSSEKHGIQNQDLISDDMKILYGDSWESEKEQIWYWYDLQEGNFNSLEQINIDWSKSL